MADRGMFIIYFFDFVLALTLFFRNYDCLFVGRAFKYRNKRLACPTKVLNDSEVAYQVTVRSVLICAAHCGQDSQCISFNVWRNKCQISWTFLDDTCSNGVEDLNKKYFEKVCMNGGDLQNGVCRCYGGYIGQFCERIMEDCTEGAPYYPNEMGKFLIHPKLAPDPFPVMCKMKFDLRTFLQSQRYAGPVSFNKNWSKYANGFGQLESWNFWLGNRNVYYLTQSRDYSLWIQLSELSFSSYGQYHFSNFRVASEAKKFRMTFSDSGRNPSLTLLFDDCLYNVNGTDFSTYDHDNDQSDTNCALVHEAGFWYNNCTLCNPNGRLWPGGNNVTLGVPNEFFWNAGLPKWSAWDVKMWLSR